MLVQDVVAISARPYGQRAVLKFAQYTGCLSIAGRFTPGTFTNQITKQFREPRLLIITDPRPDAQVWWWWWCQRCARCVATVCPATIPSLYTYINGVHAAPVCPVTRIRCSQRRSSGKAGG